MSLLLAVDHPDKRGHWRDDPLHDGPEHFEGLIINHGVVSRRGGIFAAAEHPDFCTR